MLLVMKKPSDVFFEKSRFWVNPGFNKTSPDGFLKTL